MSKRAIFRVLIDGADVSSGFAPHVISIDVNDRAGQTSDTASIVLDDTDGRIVMPGPGAEVAILLGWEGGGVGQVFQGVVDEISASGGRGGRTLTVSAKGMDTRGQAKAPLRVHMDNTTIGAALRRAAGIVGITPVIDEQIAAIARQYIALDDESFAAFGERIAREVGGTFKIVGSRAVIARRNGGKSATGASLPTVNASWGANLHTYDISPILGRNAEAKTAVRFYDRAAAIWRVVEAATGTAGATTTRVALSHAADEGEARTRAEADAQEADRKSGGGSVTIEGNIDAQPEGLCVVSGCRPGIDGTYRIEGVSHSYSRSGFVSSLELRQPKGDAGRDSR